MKNIKLLVVALIFTTFVQGQVKPQDNPNYVKTQHTVKIHKITYFVYQYKTGEYFTIKENKRTGRKYWQPLEMVREEKVVLNKLKQDEKGKTI